MPGSRRLGAQGAGPEGQRPRRPTGSIGARRPVSARGKGKTFTRACAKCGAPVPFGQRKCPSCGALVGRQRPGLGRRKRGFFTKLILLVLVVVVVGGGGLAAVLFLKPALVPAGIRDSLRGLGLPVPEVSAPEGEAAPEEGAAPEEVSAPEGGAEKTGGGQGEAAETDKPAEGTD